MSENGFFQDLIGRFVVALIGQGDLNPGERARSLALEVINSELPAGGNKRPVGLNPELIGQRQQRRLKRPPNIPAPGQDLMYATKYALDALNAERRQKERTAICRQCNGQGGGAVPCTGCEGPGCLECAVFQEGAEDAQAEAAELRERAKRAELVNLNAFGEITDLAFRLATIEAKYKMACETLAALSRPQDLPRDKRGLTAVERCEVPPAKVDLTAAKLVTECGYTTNPRATELIAAELNLAWRAGYDVGIQAGLGIYNIEPGLDKGITQDVTTHGVVKHCDKCGYTDGGHFPSCDYLKIGRSESP